MRYVISEYYDDTHQECTNCKWRGGPYDEPWKICPLCFHGLRLVGSPFVAYGGS